MKNQEVKKVLLCLSNGTAEVFKDHLIKPILTHIDLATGEWNRTTIGLHNENGHTIKIIYTSHIVKVEIEYKEDL